MLQLFFRTGAWRRRVTLLIVWLFLSLLSFSQTDHRREARRYIAVSDSLLALNADGAKVAAEKAIELAKQDHNDTLIYLARFDLAASYYYMSNHNQALPLFIENLALAKKIGWKKEIVRSLNAIANVYMNMERFKQGLDSYKEALSYCTEKGMTSNKLLIKSNMISIYRLQKNYDTALVYAHDILRILNTYHSRDTLFMSNIYGEILFSYFALKNNDSVNKYLDKAIYLKKRSGDVVGLASFYHNIAEFYLEAGNLKLAEKYYKEGTAVVHDNVEVLYNSKLSLANMLFRQKRFEEAAELFNTCIILKDSIQRIQTLEQLSEMEVKYETGKKEEQLKHLATQSELDVLKLKTSRTWLILSVIAIVLCLLLAFFMLRQVRNKHKANTMLEAQNHEILEQKKEITDSINYAKRIQTAILPPQRYVEKVLKQHFILYVPKDIVSGDFYWVDERNGKALFAAVDCTGHGVPGALMSVVGYNILSQAVKERGLTRPAEILSYLDEGVHQTLRQSHNESGIKDGMDLAICCLHADNTLECAGVYNSIWVVRKNIADTFKVTSDRMVFYGQDLLEIRPDKTPIGNNEDDVADEFTNHTLQLQSGDYVYLYSDGFADQFGGAKGKKFKYNKLKDELIAIHTLSPEEQRAHLLKTFLDWKGALEQVDDILLIGVQIV